jgi:hypothetical protein
MGIVAIGIGDLLEDGAHEELIARGLYLQSPLNQTGANASQQDLETNKLCTSLEKNIRW